MVWATALCDTSISICQTKLIVTVNSIQNVLASCKNWLPLCGARDKKDQLPLYSTDTAGVGKGSFFKRNRCRICLIFTLACCLTIHYLSNPRYLLSKQIHSILQLFNFSHYYKLVFQYIDNNASSPLLRPLFICILVIFVSFPFTWGYVLINIATGYWCGVAQGTFTMSISAVLGMTCAWHGVRRLTKSSTSYSSSSITKALSKLVGGEDKLLAIMEPLSESRNAWSILLLLRATPLPFGMINALFAITKLRFSTFLFWSWLGLIPMQIINCWIGSRVATISDVMQRNGNGRLGLIILVLQLLFSVFFIYFSVRVARKKLDKLNAANKNPDGSFYA